MNKWFALKTTKIKISDAPLDREKTWCGWTLVGLPINSSGSSIKEQHNIHNLRRSLAETFDAPSSRGNKPNFESRSGRLRENMRFTIL